MSSPVVKLSEHDKRVIGKSPFVVLQTLRSLRRQPLEVTICELSKRSGLSKPATQRAVSRLHEIGALSIERVKHGAQIHNRYQIRAIISGNDVWLPELLWLEWSNGKRTRGRPSAKRHALAEVVKLPFLEDHVSCYSEKPKGIEEVGLNSDTSYRVLIDSFRPLSTSYLIDKKNGSLVNSPQAPVFLSSVEKGKLVSGVDDDDLITQLDSAFTRSTPVERKDPPILSAPKLPPLDLPERELVGHAQLPPNTGDKFRVQHLLDCYRMVVYEVYGVQSWAFQRSDITRSKYYAKLKEAAALLIQYEIPPGSWAEWAIKGLKKKFHKKPPPIAMVFAPGYITRRRGWFRQTQDEIRVKSELTVTHHEQLLRRREAINRWRGWLKNPMLGMPSWYVKMRQDEISDGFVDPLIAYPRVKKQRGNRGAR